MQYSVFDKNLHPCLVCGLIIQMRPDEYCTNHGWWKWHCLLVTTYIPIPYFYTPFTYFISPSTTPVHLFTCSPVASMTSHPTLILTQSIPWQVFEAVTGRGQANVTSESPNFTLEGLTPGLDYIIQVTARNKLGSSDPVRLEALTYKMAENRMSEYWVSECVSVCEWVIKWAWVCLYVSEWVRERGREEKEKWGFRKLH